MGRIFSSIIHRTPIHKGWSGDQKYLATTADGQRVLLRISPAERYARKCREFQKMEEVAALGFPMCLPLEMGQCEEGVYCIVSYVDGMDAEEKIPTLPAAQQYAFGWNAGEYLRKLHTLPASPDLPDWETRFNAKIDRKIAMYLACPLKYENGDAFLAYLAQNRHLLQGRPQTYQHGDYHIGNMMVDQQGRLVIIDFDRDDYGDPWEEFNRIVWCAQTSAPFAAGMVDGYFDGSVPPAFWKLLALYLCSNTLSSLPWAIPFGEKEIAVMRTQAADILRWYDNMHTVVPSWYRDGKENLL